jgi:hypothetical protein
MSEPHGTTASEAARLRKEIRADLEATRDAYHALLNSLSDEDWHKPSGNPAWTVGQVVYHMTMAPRMLPSDVRMIRRGRRAPGLPAFIFNFLNVLVTRWGARKHTRQTVGAAYDAAHAAALAAFETIQDHEWSKGVEYPDWDPMLSGFVTIERLFRYLPLHFEVHAGQVQQALTDDSPAS